MASDGGSTFGDCSRRERRQHFSKMCIGIAVSDQQYGITTVDESANENFDSARDRMRAEQLCVMEEAQILLDNQNGVSYPAYLRN